MRSACCVTAVTCVQHLNFAVMHPILDRFWPEALALEAFLADLFACTVREDAPYDHYIPVNRSRVKRIRKQLQLSAEASAAAREVPLGTRWLVVNEHWCGDGAQILPVLEALAAASNGRIEARACFRDADTDLIDAFLTNGGRSIPKVIQFNASGEVTGTWGPRPAPAMELVQRVKQIPSANYAEPLHAWYAADRQQAIQSELVALLAQA